MRWASSASTRSPRNSSSRAFAGPDGAVSTHALPWSPELPTRRNALDEHRRARRVAQVARARERQPRTCARSVDRGDGERRHPVQQLRHLHDRPEVERLARFAEPFPSPVIDVTSPPAQNPRPAPVSTTTRTDGSSASARSSSRSTSDVLEVERVELLGPVERDGDDRAVVGVLDVDAQAAVAFAASTRAKICSGPSGVFVAFTPSGRSASSTALATAACAPIAPPSPMPL